MSATTLSQQIQVHLDAWLHGEPTGRQALDALMSAGLDKLRPLAERMLRDFSSVRRWEEADDVAQNAALRLIRALEQTRPNTARGFLALAALQVRRELLDLARHYSGPLGQGAHHASQPPNAAGTSAPAADVPAESTHNPARLAAWTQFHEKVGELPDDEREVFGLLWYQELSQSEAAVLLGVAEITVRRRWQAARRRLHDLLGSGPPF
jgi:RNA polymerase sigma-70 factor (ECF subfamily)